MKRLKSLNFLSLGLLGVLAMLVVSTPACTNEQQIEKAIEGYIEKNPEALKKSIEKVLAEKGIRGRPRPKSIEELMKNPIKVPLNDAYTMGPEDAEITIVEFSDFQCPFCKRVVPTMKQLMKDYEGKIRIAFRHHPLSFHKNAMSAAKASMAAGEQGKFWEMHDALFENQRNLSDENILKIAKDIGLDVEKFKKDWKSTKFDKQIQEDIKFARSNGATGTPAFFVNGVYVKGAKPLPYFKQLIDKLLAQQKEAA